MFRHGEDKEKPKTNDIKPGELKAGEVKSGPVVTPKIEPPKAPPDLRELIEKNLKWSQIIYEQNRKINNKLLWSAIAEWLRLAVILVPLILALWFLPPFIKNFANMYGELLNPGSTSGNKTSSVEDILKILPLSPQQEAQLKALIGNNK